MHIVTWVLVLSVAGAAVAYVVAAALDDGEFPTIGIVYVLAWTSAVLGVVSIIAGAGLLGMTVDHRRCEQYAEGARTEFRHGALAGCRLQIDDGRFVPLDQWRVIEDGDQ